MNYAKKQISTQGDPFMNLIVAVSSDWGIGRNNGLLFSLPKDMNYFKETTMGKTIILGRKTLDTYPSSSMTFIMDNSMTFVCIS